MARKRKSRNPWIPIVVGLLAGGYYLWQHTGLIQPSSSKTQTASEIRQETDSKSGSQTVSPAKSLNLGLEIPKPTTRHSEIIVKHTAFTLSYNTDMRTPNWVAWELSREETDGTEGRENRFTPDPKLPESRVTHRDYSNSGYDRGHMAPAGDMKWNQQAMRESFYTSNICPQNRKLNRDDWKDLEEACRRWAKKYGTAYIACGPIYDHPNPKRIGENQVAVPDRFYKVVLIYNRKNPFALAFLFDNEGHHHPLTHYQTTVDEIESITGYDFFTKLPDSEEAKLESVISPLPDSGQ